MAKLRAATLMGWLLPRLDPRPVLRQPAAATFASVDHFVTFNRSRAPARLLALAGEDRSAAFGSSPNGWLILVRGTMPSAGSHLRGRRPASYPLYGAFVVKRFRVPSGSSLCSTGAAIP